jgi:hypothetical protein
MRRSSLVVLLAAFAVLTLPCSAPAQCPARYYAWLQVQQQITWQRQAYWQAIQQQQRAASYSHSAPRYSSSSSSWSSPGGGGSRIQHYVPHTSEYTHKQLSRLLKASEYHSRAREYTREAEYWVPGAGHYTERAPKYHLRETLQRHSAASYENRTTTYQHRTTTYHPQVSTYQSRASSYQSGAQTNQSRAPTYQQHTPSYVPPESKLVVKHTPIVSLRITVHYQCGQCHRCKHQPALEPQRPRLPLPIGNPPGLPPLARNPDRLPQPRTIRGTQPDRPALRQPPAGPGPVVRRPQLPLLDLPALPPVAQPPQPGLDPLAPNRPQQPPPVDPPGNQPPPLDPEQPPLPPLEGVVQLKALQSAGDRQQPRGEQPRVAMLLPDEVTKAPVLPALPGTRPFDRELLPQLGHSAARGDEGTRVASRLDLERVLQPPPLPEIEVR